MESAFKNETYRPLGFISYPTIAIFVCLTVMSLYHAVLGFAYAFFHRDAYSPDESGALAYLFMMMSTVLLAKVYIWLAAAIAFLVWTYFAYNNLSPLRAKKLEFTPGSAVWWWFVPFVNLVRAFQVVREIWQASDPEVEPNNPATREASETPLTVGFWWAFFLLPIPFGWLEAFFANADRSRGEQSFVPIAFFVVIELFRATAATLVVVMIWRIGQMQNQRFSMVAKTPETELPPLPPVFEEMPAGS